MAENKQEPKRAPITGIRRWTIEGSSNIVEAGHDPISGVIEIKFKTGAVWQYPGFYSDTFEAFRKAPSVGKFFREVILRRDPTCQSHVCVTQNEDSDPRRERDDKGQAQ